MKKVEYFINIFYYVIPYRIFLLSSVIIGLVLFIITDKIFNDKLNNLLVFAFVLPFVIYAHYATEYRDKYLVYLKEFKKKSKKVKKKWTWISIAVIVGMFLLLIFSFKMSPINIF